ncbi:MAG: hypothetical protein CL607_24565 [Anaerolineaceae bacterium]|nr:hypothetical protein [Anaerolineaceae bacterium]
MPTETPESSSSKWPTRLILIIALAFLALALVDLMTQASPTMIREGQPFWYWGYVNQHLRPYFALVGLALVAFWGFLRRVFSTLKHVTLPAVLVLAFACVLFSLIIPLTTLTHTAVHMQSQSHDDAMYHLFYQSEGILSDDCAYILVRCDTFGLQCQYEQDWPYGPACMGQNAPIQLTSAGVTIDSDLIWSWPD